MSFPSPAPSIHIADMIATADILRAGVVTNDLFDPDLPACHRSWYSQSLPDASIKTVGDTAAGSVQISVLKTWHPRFAVMEDLLDASRNCACGRAPARYSPPGMSRLWTFEDGNFTMDRTTGGFSKSMLLALA
jgi:hypothetical protein